MNRPLTLQIAANLLSLAIALWLGWSPALILLLYWAENIVVALWQVPRILLAGGGQSGLSSRLATVLFFLVHYGLFTFVHGQFVFQLFLHQPMTWDALAAFLARHGTLLALTGLMVSHGVAFMQDLISGHLTWQTPAQVMSAPYSRIVVLHLVVLGSGLLLMRIPHPELALILLAAIKTFMDMRNARKDQPVAQKEVVF